MKRLVLAAVLVLGLSVAAFADVQDFGIFKADIPAGWTATQNGSTVGIVKDDSSASMSITVEESGGTSLKDLADEFVKQLNGTNLTTDARGNAVFEFMTANGAKSMAVLNCDAAHFALIVLTAVENAPEEITAILDSLKFRDI